MGRVSKLGSANTWEPRSHLPDSVFDEVPGAGPSFPFEVLATNTAVANAAALAAHKLALTPQPWVDKSSSESSPEVPGKDEWIPEPENSGADDDDGTGGDTTPRVYQLSSRSTAKASATTSAKKIVTLARVMMQRSDSVESYFRPAGHVANRADVPECSRGDFSDANKPLLNGWLDKVDRQDKYDLSWTMVDPQPLSGKRKRLKGLNEAREFGVWQHVAFVKTALLEGKYRRLVYR